jgi:hypothetical protein
LLWVDQQFAALGLRQGKRQTLAKLLRLWQVSRVIRWFEHSQVYAPSRETAGRPSDLNRPFEETILTAADGVRLQGWFFRPTGFQPAIISFCSCVMAILATSVIDSVLSGMARTWPERVRVRLPRVWSERRRPE